MSFRMMDGYRATVELSTSTPGGEVLYQGVIEDARAAITIRRNGGEQKVVSLPLEFLRRLYYTASNLENDDDD